MKKNINILRVDFDIDEQGNFERMAIRTNIDLPKEFNDEINRLLTEPIDIAVKEIEGVYQDNVTLFHIFSVALYNSGMTSGNKIVNEQFKNAREMEYKRRNNK